MAPLDDANPLAGVRRYERISSLSSGSFGLIILARDNLTGDFVAIKFIERGGHRHKCGLTARRAACASLIALSELC